MSSMNQLASALDKALDSDNLASPRLQAEARKQLLAYLALIQKWNKVFNLTAIRQSEEMLSLHLLDCIWVVLAIERLSGTPKVVVDVGSGAGLPGVVMAIMWPGAQIHCVDTVSKKAAFIHQVRAELPLANLHGHHTRIEDFSLPTCPDLITCRAYATIAQLLDTSRHLAQPSTRIAAMKAKRIVIEDELTEAKEKLQLSGFTHRYIEPLNVPTLDGERHLVMLSQQELPYLQQRQIVAQSS
jgi:16S rRNA (guanine527-N7)-methyltransferase